MEKSRIHDSDSDNSEEKCLEKITRMEPGGLDYHPDFNEHVYDVPVGNGRYMTHQLNDKEMRDIVNALVEESSDLNNIKRRSFVLTARGLFVKLPDDLKHNSYMRLGIVRIFVPETLRDVTICTHHTSILVCHSGVADNHYRMKEIFYWPGMKSIIYEFIRTCFSCACTKSHENKKSNYLRLTTLIALVRCYKWVFGVPSGCQRVVFNTYSRVLTQRRGF